MKIFHFLTLTNVLGKLLVIDLNLTTLQPHNIITDKLFIIFFFMICFL